MNIKRMLIVKTLAVAALIATSIPAMADRGEGGWRGGGWRGGEGWRGGDIRYFDRGDIGIWRGGRWIHERHEGRWGWWWVAGGMWYFYPQPVYPYPDPYIPPVVVQPNAAPQAAGQFWYYCQANNGYYPYVASCPSGWSTVPAIPPSAPAAAPPAPPGAPSQYR